MTPGAAAALLAMSVSVNRDQAQHWAQQASARGATAAELAEAWDVWERAQTVVVWTTS